MPLESSLLLGWNLFIYYNDYSIIDKCLQQYKRLGFRYWLLSGKRISKTRDVTKTPS